MPADRVINFYRVSDAFGEFSNFAAFPIRLKGVVWPSSEHYFQAQKFAGTPHEEQVRLVGSAMAAAKMGRDRSRPLRPDWEAVKDALMYEAVLAKFEQHSSLRDLLLSTGDATIVEHTKNDAYWGDGGDGSGRNMLGQTLMQVRKKLGGEQSAKGDRMFNTMFPELHVSDCEAAAQFFEKALGYKRGYTLMENGQLDFAVMKHSDPGLELMLHRMLPASESTKPRTVRLYYELTDIHSFCAGLRSNGFAVTDPQPTNYGATAAQLVGPDGYEIHFQQWNR